jgi:hypothetical protein
MLPAPVLARLVAHVTPGIATLLTLPDAAGIPPPAGFDEAAVNAWMSGLSPEHLRQFLVAVRPLGAEIVALALVELDRPPSPVGPTVAAVIPVNPPHITQLDEINVDRQEIWDRLLELLTSKKRILQVQGERQHGKSQAVILAREFREHLGNDHRLLVVDLEGRQTLEAAVIHLFAELGVTESLPARTLSDSSDTRWAGTVATFAFNRVVNLLGNTVTPWFVFDHFERMPRSDEGATFLNVLAEKVAENRNRTNAPRLLLVDHPGVTSKANQVAIPQRIERVKASDLTAWLMKHDASIAELVATTQAQTIFTAVGARAKDLVDRQRVSPAGVAQVGADAEIPDPFMSELAAELAGLI